MHNRKSDRHNSRADREILKVKSNRVRKRKLFLRQKYCIPQGNDNKEAKS